MTDSEETKAIGHLSYGFFCELFPAALMLREPRLSAESAVRF